MPQIRGCPRNCKRRARAKQPLGRIPGRRRRLRPASQETYRRCWSLAGRGASERLVRWRSSGSGRPPSCTLEVATQAFRSDGQGDSQRHAKRTKTRDVEAATSMTIYVCITCRRAGDPEDGVRPGLLLARETARAARRHRRHRAAGQVPRQLQPRLAAPPSGATAPGPMCSAGSMRRRDAEALIEGAQAVRARAATGSCRGAGAPKCLKRGLIARVPPIDFVEEES